MENNIETTQNIPNTNNKNVQDNIISNIGETINKIGVDQTMIFIGLIMIFISTMSTWFYEVSNVGIGNNVSKSVTTNTLMSGPSYLIGVLFFLCFIGILIINLMEYFGKKFDKIPFLNTDMQSTSNLLSVLLIIFILCMVSVNTNIINTNTLSPTNLSNMQIVSGLGFGFYIGFIGSVIVLVINIKKTFNIKLM